MIIGAHTIVYATDPEAARAFFRDVLGLPHVDAGHDWLIFRSPPAELAVHPAEGSGSGRLELYLMCDDLPATMAELTAKGVEFTSGVSEQRWGLLTSLRVPGAGEIGLYEPRHPTAYDIAEP
ncbi:VOC family protein [Nocardia sp. BMG111209]|uniref:VOC family protein n=1 Tax=Nocardia sp. BMG111209 TaxID=1160137 RepID=UPI0003678558|nr:VOC family protein [Nocardia sp. BMG111209]